MIARVHDEPVGDEQQVEPLPLGDPGDLLEHRQIVVAGGGTRVAPAGGVVAGAEDENAEMHLTRAWLMPLTLPIVSCGCASSVPTRRTRMLRSACVLQKQALGGCWGLPPPVEDVTT